MAQLTFAQQGAMHVYVFVWRLVFGSPGTACELSRGFTFSHAPPREFSRESKERLRFPAGTTPMLGGDLGGRSGRNIIGITRFWEATGQASGLGAVHFPRYWVIQHHTPGRVSARYWWGVGRAFTYSTRGKR